MAKCKWCRKCKGQCRHSCLWHCCVWAASGPSRVVWWIKYSLGMSAGSLVSTALWPPSLPAPITQRQALWREGKSSTSLPQPLPSQPLLYTSFFSGYPTPWKMGDPVAHPTLLPQGAKTGVEKPFRSFSEGLITWYSSTLHLSGRTEALVMEAPHLSAYWAAVFLPAQAA